MAHFAQLDDDNKVIAVHLISNAELDPDNEEDSGIAFLTSWSGGYTNWKQTSYNGTFRYNYAGVGYTYDPIDNAFIAPMPGCGHESLLLNAQKRWECSSCDELAKAL
jgi:hypothetical protein